jgi:oxygen-independent coproporphyrinogen-3 oxidase
MPAELASPQLALYVHLPWCVRKCPYCDFNSHELRGSLPSGQYIAALLEDLFQDLPRAWGRPVSSVYFGGGTPSLFSASELDRLISEIRALVTLTPDAEITLEANPGTVERDSFSAYRDAGINRVSLGAQSFDDGLLAAIGRIHGRAEIEASLESLERSGITNFNIDLMFGLPGQSLALAMRDLELAIAAEPAHISRYQLTLEPNTEFAVRPPQLPGEETCWDIQEAGDSMLVTAGYYQYEISAWAKAGSRCRHNLNYWQYGDYLGIGAGAHAKLTDPAQNSICRLVKQRHPRAFLDGGRIIEERAVVGEERVFEYFLNVLRLREGFRKDHFEARTGMSWEAASKQISRARERGLLESVDGGFRPTSQGWRFSNDLQALFLP